MSLHNYAGVDDVFSVSSGDCDLDGIYTSESEIALYGSQDNTFVSPEGDAAVEVGFFVGVDKAECYQAVLDALGWDAS